MVELVRREDELLVSFAGASINRFKLSKECGVGN